MTKLKIIESLELEYSKLHDWLDELNPDILLHQPWCDGGEALECYLSGQLKSLRMALEMLDKNFDERRRVIARKRILEDIKKIRLRQTDENI